MGFFDKVPLAPSKAPPLRVAQCGACGLYKTCTTPKMAPSGQGQRSILVVGESPSASEDESGQLYLGEASRLLRDVCQSVEDDFDLARDTWRTNALICRPPKRKPTDKEIDYCRPNILQTIKRLRPRVILLLGSSAVRSVIGHCWKDSPGSANRWAGFVIPYQKWDAWIVSSFSPAYVLRDGRGMGADLWFSRHVRSALTVQGRPSDVMPDYSQHHVHKLYDTEAIERMIDKVLTSDKMVSFDFETNMLKPDSTASEVVSCAITWNGVRTFAFPIYSDVMEPMRRFLTSPIPKVGANIKFEDRWSRAFFGVPVKAWCWDTMQASHVLDNRPEISSVKFQAFVQLGVDLYNDTIEPFLQSDAPNEPNRIRDAPLTTLLDYNGLDAWYEYHIARKQMGVLLDR